MPVPYTPDAVRAIRFASDKGMGRDDVLAELGWDASMLDRVCQRHGIALRAGGVQSTVDARSLLPADSDHSPRQSSRTSAPPPIDGGSTGVMFCINAQAKAALVQAAKDSNESLGAHVRWIIERWLETGDAERCPRYRGPTRNAYVSVPLKRASYAALVAAMGKARHPNKSEFGAAILQRHLSRGISA